MFCLRKPTTNRMQRWLRTRAELPVFTNEANIPQTLPHGFRRNQGRRKLGSGETVYRASSEALSRWQMFPHEWVTIEPREARVETGQTVAVVARCLGVWAVNACQVVDVSEHVEDGVRRFGFTYATVGDHAVRGAERFEIVWDQHDDTVWYELASYSRPRHWLVWLTLPYFRRVQRRFLRDSQSALLQSLRSSDGTEQFESASGASK